MPSIVIVAPGPLEARTGGYIFNRRIAEGLARLGWRVDVVALDASFPHPAPAALEHAAGALAAVPAGTITLIDSLALGAMPEIIVREASRLPVVALVHLPLAAAVGLDPDAAARFEQGEGRALNAVALIVVTGNAALSLLARYRVAPDRIVVVEPGTDRAALSSGSSDDGSVELLCVAAVTAGKGHEMLLTALSTVSDSRWRLTCAGSLERDPATARRVQATVARLGMADRVSFAGDVDRPELEQCYSRADVFVLATLRETYGMAVAEALAHGLPVVATATGAIPELVGHDAGLLAPVGDQTTLAEALARVIVDGGLRARLAEGARRRRDRLPTWDEACRRIAAAIEPVRSVNARG
ncbi:MAG: glycosyltransferase family 4 protein [Acidobacteria bacterium]|nr:glycosyltransferase family 4 protein [Acidobacteriota bacterium]